jgi:Ni,Fe-hydrogenase III large subunit
LKAPGLCVIDSWPALPVSLADTIVPDFPLANKSFNLSYAGNDL